MTLMTALVPQWLLVIVYHVSQSLMLGRFDPTVFLNLFMHASSRFANSHFSAFAKSKAKQPLKGQF